jgi:hypothetical protein
MTIIGDQNIPSRMDSLERRVQKLSQQKNMAIALSMAVLFFVVARDIAIATRSRNITADTISAKRIVVQGKSSSPGIVLGSDADGTPSLRFYDFQDRNRLGLGITASGAPSLAFYDSEEKKRLGMSVAIVNGRTAGSIVFCSPEEKARLQLGVTTAGGPSIFLFDDRSHLGMSIAVTSEGKAQFLMKDPDDHRAINLLIDPQSDPTLVLVDKNDRRYGLAPQDKR